VVPQSAARRRGTLVVNLLILACARRRCMLCQRSWVHALDLRQTAHCGLAAGHVPVISSAESTGREGCSVAGSTDGRRVMTLSSSRLVRT